MGGTVPQAEHAPFPHHYTQLDVPIHIYCTGACFSRFLPSKGNEGEDWRADDLRRMVLQGASFQPNESQTPTEERGGDITKQRQKKTNKPIKEKESCHPPPPS